MDIHKFEEAYLSTGGKSSELEKEDGEYTSSKAQMAWEMWLAAKAQAPQWISVNDKLPRFDQNVFCCDAQNFCFAEYFESYTNEFGVFFEEGFWVNGAASHFKGVTHWMPVKKPLIEAQEQSHD